MATVKRLIDANELYLSKFVKVGRSDYREGWNDALDAASRQAPTVDAVEVVHGHWIPIPEYENKRCSVCRTVFSDFTLGYYCPNCGAKMDGDEEWLD